MRKSERGEERKGKGARCCQLKEEEEEGEGRKGRLTREATDWAWSAGSFAVMA